MVGPSSSFWIGSHIGRDSAALSLAIAKTTIPAQETIMLLIMPKTKTIPPSQALSRPSGRMGKLDRKSVV